jgi:hypothetical protein
MTYERGYIVERQIADGSVDYWAGMAHRWIPSKRDARIMDVNTASVLAELCQFTLQRMAGPADTNYAVFHAKRLWRPLRKRA